MEHRQSERREGQKGGRRQTDNHSGQKRNSAQAGTEKPVESKVDPLGRRDSPGSQQTGHKS